MNPTAMVARHEPPVFPITPAQQRTLRLNRLVILAASDLYRAEQELLGVDVVEPWSALPPASQMAYVKRVQAMLASGIGYVHAKAKARAIRRVSVAHKLHENFGGYANQIEQIFAELFDEFETELIALFKERAK